VTGIADMADMTVFSVPASTDRTHRRIGELLGQARVNFQPVPVRDGAWKFAVKREKYRHVTELVDEALRAHGMTPAFAEGRWALVTLVGEGLRARVDEIGPRMVRLLDARGIAVEGEIRDTISFSALVHEAQRIAAIAVLHDAVIASEDPSLAAN
ncbi:MAG TPA: hypothetical protein PLZ36_16920, partial [Armatimonadota bacterium]|nr:hypothetical protein [Armatimonadota bacterium]